MSKRSRILALSLALVAVLLVGGTLAYFTSAGQGDYSFTVNGSTRVEFVGGFYDRSSSSSSPATSQEVSGLLPGSVLQNVDETNRKIGVQNVGNDCYLLVRLRITAAAPDFDEANRLTAAADRKSAEAVAIRAADEITSLESLDRIVGTLYFVGNDGLKPATMEDRAGLRSSYGYVFAPGLDTGVSGLSGYDKASNGVLLNNNFKNVTSEAEYKHGLLTFMLQEPIKAGQTAYLIDAIAAPTDYTQTLGAYAITAWAETVPVSDYEDVDAAFDALTSDSISPATNYYDASKSGAVDDNGTN